MLPSEKPKGLLRDVVGLSWPIVISMFSHTAMALVDTLFVGRLGTGPLAAVALGNVAVFLCVAFGFGLLSGGKAAVAQRFGAGDHHATRVLAWQKLWLAGLVGTASTACILVGPVLLPALGAERGWLDPALDYYDWRLLGAPAFFAGIALNSYFHGIGDTRTPMVATILANLFNIVLNPVFIFGWGPAPAMGVGGASMVTSLGFLVSMGFLLYKAWPALKGTPAGLHRALLKETWRIGCPNGGRFLLDVGSFTVFAAVLARVGEEALAAHILVVRIMSVSFLPGHAIGEAAGVLVGQAVGAADPARARAAWRAATGLATGLMAAFGLVFIAVPGLLLAPFSPAPGLEAAARDLLLIAAAFQLFDAVAMVGLGALNGAGDTRFTMVASVLCAWLVKLPIGAFLALEAGMGAAGAWLGLTAEIIAIAAICLIRIRGRRWLGEAARFELPEPALVPAK